MNRCILLLLNLVIIASCADKSTTKELKRNLNRTINLEMFDSVRQRNDLISYTDFRKMYKYISIVYLEEGCNPCYPKFVEWQNKMDTINKRNDYTVLFIIQGFRYNEFISKVREIDPLEDHYYTIMDKDSKYLLNNNDIPRWIIDSSVLIDKENKIKMVGKPWSTKEMTTLFYSICK
jgi:hypothetical protein